MLALALTSLCWAFSFGLIKRHLAGVDSSFVAAARLGLSALVFLPFLRPARISAADAIRLAAIGGVQFGAMYLLYIRAYRYLDAFEVATFTVLTPLHVIAASALLERRAPQARAVFGAALAVAGAGVITWRPISGSGATDELLHGFLLVQAANLCFALGQVVYRRWHRRSPGEARARPSAEHFAWLFLGGAAVAGLAAGGSDPLGAAKGLEGAALATLLYLALVPSGLGFFLWNVGATRVSVGTLAVMNNLKVPLGVAVALTIFGEQANLARLCAGALLIVGGLALTLGGRSSSAPRHLDPR